jgi:putative ABC transport system permease protein
MIRWFGIRRTVRLGLKSLWLHKLRSSLTMLGIIFGVCSVIAMLAIGEGASQATQEIIARLGSTNLIIETVEPPKDRADTEEQTINIYGLTYRDAESIRNTIKDVEVIIPMRQIDHEARYLTRKATVKIIGTIPWYTETSPLQVIRGRFLSSIDLNMQRNVCVVDEKVVGSLFGFDYPVGKDIQIRGNCYRVVGVAGVAPLTNENYNISDAMQIATESDSEAIGNVYMPLTTAKGRFTELEYSYTGGTDSAQKVELHQITVKVGSIDQVLPIRDVVDVLLKRLHEEKKDYRIIVPLELLRQARRTQRIFSIVLGSIAAISLLVGGIGIMNIMLATVSERTREIGIRRALGAKKRDIIIQFLSETLILTLCGGIIGIGLGFLLPKIVTHFGRMPTVITGTSLMLAFGISVAVGIIFGLYPAYRAANMDPIESLRHE